MVAVLLTDDQLRHRVFEEVKEADDDLSIRDVHIILDALIRVTDSVALAEPEHVIVVDELERSDG